MADFSKFFTTLQLFGLGAGGEGINVDFIEFFRLFDFSNLGGGSK